MPRLSVQLLGPFQVTCEGKPVTEFRSDRARALLAYLALAPAQPHRREALAGLLWPEQPDQTARNNLRLALHRLRLAIGEEGLEPPNLTLTTETVQFEPRSDTWVDSAAFTRLLDEIEQHDHRRLAVCPACVARLGAASELYRGDLLQGFFLDDSVAFAEWLLIRREGLHQRALGALYTLSEVHRRRGENALAVRYARQQLALEPWREEAHRQLMLALALGGERSAALAQFEACRKVLAHELDAPPAPETTALYERILGLRGVRPYGLPRAPSRLVGRDDETAALTGLLADPDCRLVTVVGPGGSGKTRLALEAAARRAPALLHGACFVPLSAVASTSQLPQAIGRALGVPLTGKSMPAQEVLAYVSAKELLLLLDSFEHLGDGAQWVPRLLDTAPQVTVLATSRERLGLQEEWLFPLGGLACPPAAHEDPGGPPLDSYGAVRLFVEAARRVQPGYALAGPEAAAVADICQLVAGMPLALELAAANLVSASSRTVAREIARSLDFLASMLRNVPERQRSVRASFDYSWQLLGDAERRALRRLAVFRGFEVEAAQAVAGAPAAGVAALAERSLLRHLAAEEAPDRFDLHDLVRQFALEHLAAAGEAANTRDRHMAWCVTVAEAAVTRLRGAEAPRWLGRLAREHDNFAAALDWSLDDGHERSVDRAHQGLRLGGALAPYWCIRGPIGEGRDWLERLLAATTGGDQDAVRGRALSGAGDLAYAQGQLAAAQARYKAALGLWRSAGQPAGQARALAGLGNVAWVQARYAEARRLHEASRDLYQSVGDSVGMADALRHMGMALRLQGEVDLAEHCYAESRDRYQAAGEARGLAQALEGLGVVARVRGDLDRARQLHLESLSMRRALDDRLGEAYSLINLGTIAHQSGDLALARPLIEQSLAIRRDLGDQVGVAAAVHNLGDIALDEGQVAVALERFEESLRLHRDLGDVYNLAGDLRGIGEVRLRQGDRAAARALFEDAAEHYRVIGARRAEEAAQRDMLRAKGEGGELLTAV
jgi:predicted ATPase/DNA-binding SARP family transcriptional activator